MLVNTSVITPVIGDEGDTSPGISLAFISEGDPDHIWITFNGDVSGNLLTGVTYSVDPITSILPTGAELQGNLRTVKYTCSPDFFPTDLVSWQYSPGTLIIGGEALGVQDKFVANNLINYTEWDDASTNWDDASTNWDG